MGKLNKTDREWQRELSPDEFRITRQKGTEPAFTGKYWNTKQTGTYLCRCCGAELSLPIRNMIVVVVGQAFINRLPVARLMKIKMRRMVWSEPRLFVIIAMHIWGMFLKMVHSRLDCAIA